LPSTSSDGRGDGVSSLREKFIFPLFAGKAHRRPLSNWCENNNEEKGTPMQVKTLLNTCHRIKGFVYACVRFERVRCQSSIVAEVRPRQGSKPLCSGCGRKAPGYDVATEARLFQFVPIWGYQCYLRYPMRRVQCKRCGVKTERVPWAEGKVPLCRCYQLFLAGWARRLSWKQTADAFRTSWHTVYSSVELVVQYGLRHRNLEGISSIGVDEWQWRKGHDYVTLVYQIDGNCRRLLHIAEKRTVRSLLSFFRMLGPRRSADIRYVCSDMWKPYLKVIAKKIPQALHILDRFHIVANLNKALNEIRATEAKRLNREGYEEVLKHTKYCFAKNPENLTEGQKARLDNVMRYDLKSVKAYLLKESFQVFWSYRSPYWARWYLKKWCYRAARSKLDPIKKFVKSIRKHEELIINYFKAKCAFSSGIVEGLNRNVNLVTRKAYGYRTFNALEVALYHTLGDLPEPKSTHEFF
jgi:transposase